MGFIGSGLAAAAAIAFLARLRLFVRLGPFALGWHAVDWRAVGLAVLAFALLAIAKQRSPSRTRWARVAMAAACAVLAGTLLVGFAPQAWRELVVLDVLSGGRLSIATASDYVRSDIGPRLLAHLNAGRLLEDRSDAALTWMALRQHAWSPDAIVAEPRHGRRVLFEILREEANPPPWWGEEWRSRVATAPAGTLRMGLISEEAARAGLREAVRSVRSLPFVELEALMGLAGLHPGLLAAPDVEAVLEAWRERWLPLGRPLEAVSLARRTLSTRLGYGNGRMVGLRVEAATIAEAPLVPAVASTLGHLLGTIGYLAQEGDDLRVVFAVEEREFRNVRREYAAQVYDGTRTRTKAETGVRWVGRYWLPLRQHVTITESQDVFRREEQNFRGLLLAPVLVLHVIGNGAEHTFEAPPFGFVYCGGPGGDACEPLSSQPIAVLDANSAAERGQYGLPGREEFLLASWRWALPPGTLGIKTAAATPRSGPK